MINLLVPWQFGINSLKIHSMACVSLRTYLKLHNKAYMICPIDDNDYCVILAFLDFVYEPILDLWQHWK